MLYRELVRPAIYPRPEPWANGTLQVHAWNEIIEAPDGLPVKKERQMPRNVVRYGIISTSGFAQARHVPAARESTNSEIVAVSSRDEAKARRVAEQHG